MPRRRLVALDLPPGEEFAAALDAAWERGDAVLPVDPSAPAEARARLRAAMCLDEPVDDGVALVIATSGSTGGPKGAQLSAAALEASARATMARIGLDPEDRWLSCLPWHHIGGLQVLLRARLFHTPLVVHERFDVERFAAASDVTLTSLVPTQLARLLDGGVDLTRFRAILLGGARAPESLVRRARDTGVHVVTTYGMSETAGGCVYDGVPLDGVDVRVDEDRRVWLRGPMLMTGYRKQPDLTRRSLVGGWLRTEDTGVVHADGTLVVHGRLDDVVVTGGENVVAGDVEDVLAVHPSIAGVVVTGVPDETWGDRVVAVVAVRPGASLSLDDVRAWASSRLGPAALPRGLVVVDAIPLLAAGKPDREAVRALARAAAT